ncbi:MAG: four helix bundle protein [Clostridia bacterium]|nr:four helix bundle protein [Clostridia bacterium]
MRDNPLVALSKQFAIDIIRICEDLREKKNNSVLSNQLLRCGTSIGANIHEANYASSKADFVNKLHIALKECYETEYWLGLLCETSGISLETFKDLNDNCCKIRRLLVASITTAKRNMSKSN